MSTSEINAQLEELCGQRVNRAGVIHVVQSYKHDEDIDCYQITTDREVFKLHKGRMADWFKGTIAEGAANQISARQPVYYQPAVLNSETLGKLRDVLLDNIKQVKANPDYRTTAEAVKGQVDSLIDIAKVEASALSSMASIAKRG
jgi:hypothetical protein